MGYTRIKKNKKRWGTRKRVWRGGANLVKTRTAQQTIDAIHDFYYALRGVFKKWLEKKPDNLSPEDLQTFQLYMTMRSINQFFLIKQNARVLQINIDEYLPPPTTRNPQPVTINMIPINHMTDYTYYVGNKKQNQLLYAGNVPNSGVTVSNPESTGRKFFDVPPGREWPKLQDPFSSVMNLLKLLFNTSYAIDPNDPIHQIDPNFQDPNYLPLLTRLNNGELNEAVLYTIADAGMNTIGTLFEEAYRLDPNRAPKPCEIDTPMRVMDSAISTLLQNHIHEFPETSEGVFISDPIVYCNDNDNAIRIKYEKHNWNSVTGLGFLYIIEQFKPNDPQWVDSDPIKIIGGIQSEGQISVVRQAGSKAALTVYNSLGPSCASLIGCIIKSIIHKVKQEGPIDPILSTIKDRVSNDIKDAIDTELRRIMRKQNGISELCGFGNMVDLYNLLDGENENGKFYRFPPALWYGVKGDGDRGQVKAANTLSKKRKPTIPIELQYLLLIFVTVDELCAKIAVELGLATIYQAGGVIRYWPRMFLYHPASRTLPDQQFASVRQFQLNEISQFGGKQIKGGFITYNDTIGLNIEDEGEYGLRNIRINSPQIIVHPENGGTPWIIPALLTQNRLLEDGKQLVAQFVNSIYSHFFPFMFGVQGGLPNHIEIQLFESTLEEVTEFIYNNNLDFIQRCGVNPIYKYLRIKYEGLVQYPTPQDIAHEINTMIEIACKNMLSDRNRLKGLQDVTQAIMVELFKRVDRSAFNSYQWTEPADDYQQYNQPLMELNVAAARERIAADEKAAAETIVAPAILLHSPIPINSTNIPPLASSPVGLPRSHRNRRITKYRQTRLPRNKYSIITRSVPKKYKLATKSSMDAFRDITAKRRQKNREAQEEQLPIGRTVTSSHTNNFTTAAAKIRRENREAQKQQLEVGRGGKRKNKTKKRSKSKPHSS